MEQTLQQLEATLRNVKTWRESNRAEVESLVKRPRRSDGGLLGRKVVVRDLRSRTELNGLTGTAKTFLQNSRGTAKAKYLVTLPSGTFEIRARCLVDATAPKHEEAELWEQDALRVAVSRYDDGAGLEERKVEARERSLLTTQVASLQLELVQRSAAFDSFKAEAAEKEEQLLKIAAQRARKQNTDKEQQSPSINDDDDDDDDDDDNCQGRSPRQSCESEERPAQPPHPPPGTSSSSLLKSEVAALRAALAQASAAKARLCSLMAQKEGDVAELESENAQLRVDLRAARMRVAELAERAADAEGRAVEVAPTSNLGEVEELKAALKAQIAQKAQAHRECEHLRKKVTDSARDYLQKMVALKKAETVYRDDISVSAELRAENLRLRAEHNEIFKQVKEGESLMTTQKKEIQQLRAATEETIKAVRAEGDAKIKRDAAALSEVQERASRTIQELQASVVSLKDSNKALKHANKDVDGIVAKFEAEEIALRRELEKSAMTVEHLEQLFRQKEEALVAEQLYHETTEAQFTALKVEAKEAAELAAHAKEAAATSWAGQEKVLRDKIAALRTIVERVSALVGPLSSPPTTTNQQEDAASDYAMSRNQAEEHRALREELQRERQVEMEELRKAVKEKDTALQRLGDRLSAADQNRRKIHNQLVELRGNIRVVVRVRPFLESDPREELPFQFDPLDHTRIAALGLSNEQTSAMVFSFDRVFAQSAGQNQIFEEVQGLIQSCLDGYRVCLLSYGQTGSGKTFTMQGSRMGAANRGIIPRALDQILGCIEEQKESVDNERCTVTYSVTASVLEICNETIRDLLLAYPGATGGGTSSGAAGQLSIRKKADGETFVQGLRQINIVASEKKQLSTVLAVADKARSVAATEMNQHSSRSHSVFTLQIERRESTRTKGLPVTSVRRGKLSLVDLAGSERLDKSKAFQKERLKETQAINRSLSALGNVFAALAAGQQQHINFRDSK